MNKTCPQCKEEFEITERDQEFYKTIKVPHPTLCPFCRMIRRLSYRKERFLYHRVCDLTGKQIISAYPKDLPLNRKYPLFPVYDIDAWWSDKWDAKAYGRPYDFSRPFFEQFFELQAQVPRMALIQQKPMENSAYCNAASMCKNCYLIFSTNQNEDCYYGSWINYCKDCIDNLSLQSSELCYDNIYSRNCYRCFYAQEAKNCSDCMLIKNCIACKDCFMCTNLNQKQYYFFNKPYSKEEYSKKLKQYDLGDRKVVDSLKQEFKKMCGDRVVKYYVGTSNENSTGNYINNNKNADTCFELDDCENATYCNNLNKSKNVMDHSYWGENAELIYESQACGYDLFNLKFCNLCWRGCSDLEYCDNCFSSKKCFGCVGLKKASYCILNKQYSKEEYEDLVPRIIEHMKKTSAAATDEKEYGEFFPSVYSPFAYNETLAYEHQPLAREAVIARGWQWLDRSEEYEYQGPKVELPENIKYATEDIPSKILTCGATGRNYKILRQELNFYKKQNIPLPDKCPDQRHNERLALRNPRRLWGRTCAKCQTSLKTSYAPDRPEKVYCEACYLKAVY